MQVKGSYNAKQYITICQQNTPKMNKYKEVMTKYSFQRGYSQVRLKDLKEVKSELMSALNITTQVSWTGRIRGKVIPKIDEAAKIEQVFAKYGITDVWGEE